jgi:hypothetical protein
MRISQLADYQSRGMPLTHSVETKTNTWWPVMCWFTRQWVMWCYLTWVSSPPRLHLLLKINWGYFPNSPHIKQVHLILTLMKKCLFSQISLLYTNILHLFLLLLYTLLYFWKGHIHF